MVVPGYSWDCHSYSGIPGYSATGGRGGGGWMVVPWDCHSYSGVPGYSATGGGEVDGWFSWDSPGTATVALAYLPQGGGGGGEVDGWLSRDCHSCSGVPGYSATGGGGR